MTQFRFPDEEPLPPNVVPFPEARAGRAMGFWNILAGDPTEYSAFLAYLETAERNAAEVQDPDFTLEMVILSFGAGPPPEGFLPAGLFFAE